MKSWHFKLLAVLLAVIMWYFVVGEERAEVGLTAPLILINMPRDLIVVNNVPHGIEIRVNGPSSLVRSLSAENLSKSLDLSNAREGTVSFSISAEGIPLPRGVKITQINPTQVTVVLQKLLTKTIVIHPRVTGRPASGFELVSVKINPEQVDIAGPDEVVKKIEGLYTKPIDIQGLKSDLKQRTFLDFRNYQIYLVKEVPLEVEVNLKKGNRK
jgi:YbbR domain-containing protein